MNSIVLEHINDLFDSYDLFSSTGKKEDTQFNYNKISRYIR